MLNYEPYHARGGILADEMGLGKTLQIISLIACTSLRARWGKQDSDDEDSEDDDKDEEGPALAEARPTLVVSPLSVLSQWEKQFKDHVRMGHLDVEMYGPCLGSEARAWLGRASPHLNFSFFVTRYYGPQRSQDVNKWSNKDVVLTTYNTLSKEYDDPNAEALAQKQAAKKRRKEEGKVGKAGKPTQTSSKFDDSEDDSEDEFDQDGINKAFSLDEDGKKVRLDLPTAKKTAKPKKVDASSRKKSSPMYKIRWQRVVLDEAHIIRDRSTLQSKVCFVFFFCFSLFLGQKLENPCRLFLHLC